MKQRLEKALELAQKGFKLFPLAPNAKVPAEKGWKSLATGDESSLKKWFGNGREYNLGISTDRFTDRDNLIVIDIDCKGGKPGYESILRLELEGFDFPKTYEQLTPSGGRHLFYRTKQKFGIGVDVLGPGVDIRAVGGYVVGPESTISGKKYQDISREIALLPKPIEDLLIVKSAEERTWIRDEESDFVDEDAAPLATAYLEKEAPLAIEGQGGDQTTFTVACRVKDFGLDEKGCLDLLLKYWNERCSPPWPPEELQEKVRNAYIYGKNAVGTNSPKKHFKESTAEGKSDADKSYLQKLNENYAVIYIGDSHYILYEGRDHKDREQVCFYNEATFRRKFSPYKVQASVGGRIKTISQADVWLDWKKRREYQGVVFHPGATSVEGYYNLWRGISASPLPRSDATPEQLEGVRMFYEHIRDNICQGDSDLFRWFIGFFAHMVQVPQEKPATAIVVRGSKGTGKSIVMEILGRLIGGRHFVTVSRSGYLSSRFNAHMDACLFLLLSEAFWSGDKDAENNLKSLITDTELLIERKGKDAYQIDTFCRVVILSNEDWVVPASFDERRFAVFEIGDARRQDNDYFGKMRRLLEVEGANRVLLWDLMQFDLSKVNLRKAPSTKGLFQQKLESLRPIERWWFDSLVEGHFDVVSSHTWPEGILTGQLRDSFSDYCRRNNMKGWGLSVEAFGRWLRKFCHGIRNVRARQGSDFGRKYKFPTLEEARKDFGKYLGHEVNWDEF